MSRILTKHRAAALLGAALIISPVAFSMALGQTTAGAVTGNSAVAASTSLATIVAVAKPAVVTVTTKLKPTDVSYDGAPPLDGNSPFEEQFRQFFGGQGNPMPQPDQNQPRAEALGSGFIIDASGLIVTNNHVIDNAADIKVTLDDGTELPAILVGHDAKSDLAVLRVKASNPLPTVSWGDSDHLRAGDQILAIGNPFGIGTTVTSGIVSARGRDLNNGPYDDFIQVDAPINHGNSGGPLVDIQGKVVGINTAIYSPNGGSVGVGFAIPSDEAQAIVAKLIKKGSIEHGVLGIKIQPVTQDVADAIGLKQPGGALIDGINPGSPASAAALKIGDVVLGVGNQTIKAPKDLSRIIADMAPGTTSELTIWRDGKDKRVAIRIGGDTSGQQTAQADPKSGRLDDPAGQRVPTIGLGLGNLTEDVRQALNLPEGQKGAVVESVNPDKAAADAGIQPGDVIVSVNQKPVHSASDAKNAVADAGKAGRKSVLLLVKRGDSQSFVAIPFGTG